MLREVILKINSCDDCPFLKCHDGFADHTYECTKLKIFTNKSYGHDGSEEAAYRMMRQWFLNQCPLKKIE